MKKVLKIVGITLLVIIGGFIIITTIKNLIVNNSSWFKDNYYEDFKSESELEKKYSGIGKYEVAQVKYKSENKNIKNIRVWYPKELEKEDKTYPTIFVVNASNVASFNLGAAYKRLASWGFIVVGNDDRQSGTGESASETLNFILNADKDNVLYNKVDKDNIGIIGYSQGGAGALRAITEFENSKYYKTIFTGSASYSTLSKNMGWGYDMTKVNIPYFMTAGTGESDDRGLEDITNEFGGVAPLSSLIDNYNKMTNDVFKIRARVTGAEHQDMLNRTDGYMTAWMLYRLQNDSEVEKVFVGENAEILVNSNWQDIEKNK